MSEVIDLRSINNISQRRKMFYEILNNNLFNIHYQPIVDVSNGQIYGYEALTRGPKENYFYSPNRLFPFAESENSLYKLEKITRELAYKKNSNFLRF